MTIEPVAMARIACVPAADSHPSADQDFRSTDPAPAIAAQRESIEVAELVESSDSTGATAWLLRMAGLTPDEGDLSAMSGRLDAARSAVRALYAVAEARYEDPGLAFRAMP